MNSKKLCSVFGSNSLKMLFFGMNSENVNIVWNMYLKVLVDMNSEKCMQYSGITQKMFALFGMNSKKAFTIVLYFLSENVTIVWYQLWNVSIVRSNSLYRKTMITRKLGQLCQKQCNQIDLNHLKYQFSLGLLKLPIKECMDYEYGLYSFSYKLLKNIVTRFVATIQSSYKYHLDMNYFNLIVFCLIPLFRLWKQLVCH